VAALAADRGFSGVVRVDRGDTLLFADAYGFADRAHRVVNTPETVFALASGVKGITALVVMSLIEQGVLSLTTPARAVLGGDLPLIDDRVTVGDLLAHRSGIGDYVDEEGGFTVNDYVLPLPVHRLVNVEDYLPALDGYPQKFPPGERFSYCNGGFVVLALISQRASATAFDELVRQRVCEPAGMASSAFLRSDELAGNVARGYLTETGLRTNVLHLPVRGSGDGGLYSTVADINALWRAMYGGSVGAGRAVREMTPPHHL